MAKAIVIRKSIFVSASPEVVWDFTQDYNLRPLWDNTVKSAEVIEIEPFVKVRIIGRDGSKLIFEYKFFERPARTTLSMEVERSRFFEKGGGS
ncbi:MAG: SRPBCC family protein [Saprospiraceae bacterium]